MLFLERYVCASSTFQRKTVNEWKWWESKNNTCTKACVPCDNWEQKDWLTVWLSCVDRARGEIFFLFFLYDDVGWENNWSTDSVYYILYFEIFNLLIKKTSSLLRYRKWFFFSVCDTLSKIACLNYSTISLFRKGDFVRITERYKSFSLIRIFQSKWMTIRIKKEKKN